MNVKKNEEMAIKVSQISIISDIFLCTGKIITGIVGHSTAMIADGIHSLSDLLSTVVVIIGIKFSGKKADKSHPYGHERFESVAAILLAILLMFTAGSIGWLGMSRILNWNPEELVIPTILPLFAAVATIIVKGIMFFWKRSIAKKIDSTALLADAWHHLTDCLSSVGAIIGIVGARLGFPLLDPLAALAICLLILKVSFDIFKDAISKMTDQAVDEVVENEIRQVILSHELVKEIDVLRTRLFGNRVFVDVEISVPIHLSFEEVHQISHSVHDEIELKFPKVKHCKVHANPIKTDV